jgi:hemerythrin superfamily protein
MRDTFPEVIMDAIELLKRDHQAVTELFQRFSAAKGGRAGEAVVEKICKELEVHSQIEEEIFYPAVRKADAELAELVNEALREHGEVKQQVAALQSRDGGGNGELAEEVTALQQNVEHHVTGEEGEMFPRVAEVLDERRRAELGDQLQERKEQLMGGRARRPARRARSTSRKRRSARGRRATTAAPRRKTARGKSGGRKTAKKRARGR